MTDGDSPRRWRGETLDVRRATRRQRLMDAGFRLLGEGGSSALTVRGVAREAQLSERYFYESFADRDELALAIHGAIADEVRVVIAQAVAIAPQRPEDLTLAAIGAFTDFLEEDPRRGRVLLAEPFTDTALAMHGIELIPSFADLLFEQISTRLRGPDLLDAKLSSVALVGALAHLYLGWINGSLPVDRQRLVVHAARLVLAAGQVSSAP